MPVPVPLYQQISAPGTFEHHFWVVEGLRPIALNVQDRADIEAAYAGASMNKEKLTMSTTMRRQARDGPMGSQITMEQRTMERLRSSMFKVHAAKRR